MKLFLALALSFFALSAQARTDLVFVGDCGNDVIDSVLTYKTAVTPGDKRVKAEIRMTEYTSGSEFSDSHEIVSPILPQLENRGTAIVDKASGQVCAKWQKPGPLGKRTFVPTRKCTFSFTEKETTTLDQDGFQKVTTCVRSYYLNVK